MRTFVIAVLISLQALCGRAVSAQPTTAVTTDTAVFAEGCFWGTQYVFSKAKGVISTRVGYTGGIAASPTYKQVCTGDTHHLEAIEITFDPTRTTYEEMARLFFETHDPTQKDGQGPDIGEQYQSAVFYRNDEQKKTAEKLIDELRKKGMKIATRVVPASTFWPAEDYHQNYYAKNGGTPYCHTYHKLF